MTTDDVLAGLDGIDWAELEHAYGSAEDVPGLLRALCSDAPDERKRTIRSLYGNIFHQGTRYQATAFAVPFLVRLALHPATFQRYEIVDMLGSIAVGYDEAYLPKGIDIAGQRTEIEQLGLVDPAERMREFDEWVEAATDEADRRRRETRRAMHNFDYELRSALDHLGSYDAVRAQVPALRGLLADADPDLRASTTYLLGWFPEESDASVRSLMTLIASETVPAVTANAIVALGLIGTADLVPQLRAYLDGPDALLRWAAAIALARLGEHDSEVVQALAEATANPPEYADQPRVRFLEGNLRGYASQSLAMLADALTPKAFESVLEGLSRSKGPEAFSITAAVVGLVFPRGAAAPLPSFEELSDRQQRVVRVLADLGPETWRWGNFTNMLSSLRLPAGHAEIREYAGLPPLQ